MLGPLSVSWCRSFPAKLARGIKLLWSRRSSQSGCQGSKSRAEPETRHKSSSTNASRDGAGPLLLLDLVSLTSSSSEPRLLAVPSDDLITASPFFEALLLRWRPDILGTPQSPTSKPYSFLCEDSEAASLAIQLVIACGVSTWKELPRLPFVLQSVGKALSVIAACSYFLADRWIISHVETFLDACEWTSEDQENIKATFQSLGLYMAPEMRDRLGIIDSGWPWSKRYRQWPERAEGIIRSVLAAALRQQSGPIFCKYFTTEGEMDASERPRLVLEELAKSGWLGLSVDTLQSIVEAQMDRIVGFKESRSLLAELSVKHLRKQANAAKVDKNLHLFIRQLSSVGWLSSLCLNHSIALEEVRTEWLSTEADSFVKEATEKILRHTRADSPLSAMLYHALFQPLQKLFDVATCKKMEHPTLFDEPSKKELVRIWLPVLLIFEQGELLDPTKKSWRSVPSFHFTPPDDNDGTDYSKVSHWGYNWFLHRWESATNDRVLAIRAAKDAREREALAQMLYEEASGYLQKHGASKFANFRSEVPFEAPSFEPLLPLFLETSALILRAVADPNNLVLWDVRCPFLKNVLPVLVDADVNRTLRTETVENFRTSFASLAMDRQEEVARKWAKALPFTRPVGKRGLLLDRVFIDWCVSNAIADSHSE